MQLAIGDVARHAHSSSGRDARLTGIDLSGLSGALKPSVVVTAADLARPACAFPNSRLATSLPVGKTPLYLGQPVPVLILRISTSLIRRVSRWAMQLP